MLCMLKLKLPKRFCRREATTCLPSRLINKPSSAILSVFIGTLFPPVFTTTQKAHGRIETRMISTAPAHKKLKFFGVKQVICVTRRRELKNYCEFETTFYVTSLSQKKASKEFLLGAIQNHWSIENKLHYVKDVTFDEDRIRYSKNPALISVLRGFAISLTKLFGFKLIPTAQRFFASNQHCFFGR